MFSFDLKNTHLCKKLLCRLKEVNTCSALLWKAHICAKSFFSFEKAEHVFSFTLKSTHPCKKRLFRFKKMSTCSALVLKSTQMCKKRHFRLKKVSTCSAILWRAHIVPKVLFCTRKRSSLTIVSWIWIQVIILEWVPKICPNIFLFLQRGTKCFIQDQLK